MLIQPYQADELKFAWCYRVFFRWRTWRRRPIPALAGLTTESMNFRLEQYQVRLLEFGSDTLDIRAIASLQPQESTATAASKTKGQLCRAVSEQVSSNQKTFARGYFAATVGTSTANEVKNYLDTQSEHHGYDRRPQPPTHVAVFVRDAATPELLATDHAVTSLRFHIVLATWKRQGVFTSEAAKAVVANWRDQQAKLRVVFDKFSFLPDHVHIAVEVHPTVSPALLVTKLMNVSQEFAFENFPENVIRAKAERLWQPSAYIGSFGNLTTAAMKSYIDRWGRAKAE